MAWSWFAAIPGTAAVPATLSLLAIDDPDVTLTDFGLAVEAGLFAVLLAWPATRWDRLRGWGVAFFGSAALASLAGGLDHGFFRRDGREFGHDVLWVTSLLAIGVSSLALAGIAAELGLGPVAGRRVVTGAAVALAAYAAVVLFAWREFLVAIVAYAPAALFLLVVLARRYGERRDRESLTGIVAVVLAFVAAAVQRIELAVHEHYLDHNALYHLIQAVSFALFFLALRGMLRAPAGPGNDGGGFA